MFTLHNTSKGLAEDYADLPSKKGQRPISAVRKVSSFKKPDTQGLASASNIQVVVDTEELRSDRELTTEEVAPTFGGQVPVT